MTEAQLLAAVRDALKKQDTDSGPVGITTADLAEALGVNQEVSRKRIAALVKAGKAVPVRVRRLRWDGVSTTVPAIQLAE